MSRAVAKPLKAVIAVSLLALGGCAQLGNLFPASRSRSTTAPAGPPADPPATESGICQLARQAVREAMGIPELRGDTCTAAHTRPGEWQARVDFASGSGQHTYRLQLQPQRQRQGWAVVDITPEATSS
jgi:hypothetical protein